MTDETQDKVKSVMTTAIMPVVVAALGALFMWQLNNINSSIIKLNKQQNANSVSLATISQQIGSLKRSRDKSQERIIDLYKKYSKLEHRLTVVENSN